MANFQSVKGTLKVGYKSDRLSYLTEATFLKLGGKIS